MDGNRRMYFQSLLEATLYKAWREARNASQMNGEEFRVHPLPEATDPAVPEM